MNTPEGKKKQTKQIQHLIRCKGLRGTVSFTTDDCSLNCNLIFFM